MVSRRSPVEVKDGPCELKQDPFWLKTMNQGSIIFQGMLNGKTGFQLKFIMQEAVGAT